MDLIFPGSFVTLLNGFIPYEVTKVMDGRVWVIGGRGGCGLFGLLLVLLINVISINAIVIIIMITLALFLL